MADKVVTMHYYPFSSTYTSFICKSKKREKGLPLVYAKQIKTKIKYISKQIVLHV